MNGKVTHLTRTVGRMTIVALAILIISGVTGAWSAPPESDRMARKMNVLERIFDEVLRESENVLVSGEATRGLLLEGYGALFTFDGSLGGRGLGDFYFDTYSSALGSYTDESEWVVPPVPPVAPKAPAIDDEDVRVPDSVEGLARNWEEKREERNRKARERLAALKIELTETLLDYGATLGELQDDDWVAVAAFLHGFGRGGDGPERLVLKVKMRDLRQYSAGQLSLDQAKNRVTVEEK